MGRWLRGGLLWRFAGVSLAVVALLGVALGWVLGLILERAYLYGGLAVGLLLLWGALFALVKRSHETIGRQQSRLAALYRTGQSLRSTLDPQEVLQRIIAEATTLVHGEGGVLMLLDEARDELVAVAAHNWGAINLERIRFARGEGLAGKALAEDICILAEDALRHPDFRPSANGYRDRVPRSLICVPLKYRARVMGVINVSHYTRPRAFTQEDMALVEEFAGQAAIAVEQAQAFGRERALRTQLETVNEAALRVGAESSLEALLQRIVELAKGLAGAQYAALGVLGPEGGLRHFVTLGVSEAQRAAIGRLPQGKGLLGVLRREPRSLRLRDLGEHPASVGFPPHHPQMTSFLGVPICLGNRMVGSFYMTNREGAPEFSQEDQELLERLAAHAALAIEKADLLATVQERAQALQESYHATLEALSAALDLRDGETESHSQRTVQRTRLLAQALGVPPQEQEDMVMGALLHDVGKIGVSDAILRKPGPLTPEEWAIMRQHPRMGYQMLASIPFLARAATIVCHHHERYDGSGYPDGLKGEEIPLGSRIFAVVDAYDAITSDRPYRKARSHREAVQEITRCAGSQFDPQVVAAFLSICDQFAEPATSPYGRSHP